MRGPGLLSEPLSLLRAPPRHPPTRGRLPCVSTVASETSLGKSTRTPRLHWKREDPEDQDGPAFALGYTGSHRAIRPPHGPCRRTLPGVASPVELVLAP